MSLLSLSTDSKGTKVSFWSILFARWDLVLVICIITFMFVLNEIRIQFASTVRMIPNMTIPPVLLVMLLFYGLSYPILSF